jgi:hypothetical protein
MLNNNIYYSTKGIYGVQLYTYNNNECNILFKQQLNTLMTNEMMEEVTAFYESLDEHIKKDVKFKLYHNCNSIDNKDNCMIWFHASLNSFRMHFGNSENVVL